MFWAHGEAVRSPWCLSQSGMPAAPLHVLEGRSLADLSHADQSAQPELRRRLAALLDVEESRILLTLGASGGMQLAAQALFRPSTRVLAETPSYDPLRALPAWLGAEVRLLERRAERGFTFDMAEAERLASGASGPCHVFITNSHNPSGALLPAAELAALAAVAARRHGVLVSCEVYMEFASARERVHAALVAPNAISIGSLTKAYGLGPLRVGWCILGEDLAAEREHFVDLTYLGHVDPPTPALVAALNALDHLDELVRRLREVERESKPRMASWLAQRAGLACVAPRLGITAFPRLAPADEIDAPGAARALARFLQQAHQVDVVPGDFFDRPGHLRLGFGLPPATLDGALERLGRGLDAWRGLDARQRAGYRVQAARTAAPRLHPL